MPGFPDLLKRVREFYDTHPSDIRAQGEELAQALGRMQPSSGAHASSFSREPLDAANEYLQQALDPVNGGFSGAPKFPHAETIELLLRRYASSNDVDALESAVLTLRKMALGGIYDQLGGGFARYSVDAEWAIPHFEKMLYDNAWLLRLYADAWAITRDPLFERICAQTAAWVMREMQSPEGGYYSALDADSEGEEGKFYVWSVDEVRALLTPEEFTLASITFGLDRPPNFENHAWNLVMANPVVESRRALLDSARAKLLAARGKRVRPGLDDKVLTSWNALMIAGMAHAARVFGRREWLDSARRALTFLRDRMRNGGHLLATYKDGRAHLDAYLDDHAYLLAALLEMLQADFDPRDLEWATEVADALMDRFHDGSSGGFFFTSHDHEKLIQRPKPGPDNATPSGNAIAALALHRLAFLTGETRFSDAAAGTIALFLPQVERYPGSFGTMLAALEEQVEPPRTLILRGDPAEFAPWRAWLDKAYLPTTLVLFIPANAAPLPEPLAKPPKPGVNAWLCEGVTCLTPIDDADRLREALKIPKIAAPT
jgi:hypothetical protein